VLANDNLLAQNLRERLSALVTIHKKLEQTQLLELQRTGAELQSADDAFYH